MNPILYAALLPPSLMSLPEVGKEETVKLQKTITAMERVAQSVKERSIQTIVVMTPHGASSGDAMILSVHPRLRGALAAQGAPEVMLAFETDGLLLKAIQRQAERLGINLLSMTDDKAKSLGLLLELDYGSLIPLFYLHQAGFRGQIIHLSCGRAAYEELYTLGKAVQAATGISGKRVGVIASGELSSCLTPESPGGYHPSGALFDQFVLDRLATGDWKSLMFFDRKLAEEAKESALRSILFLAGTLGGQAVTSEILSYEIPFGVGYAVAQFF